MIAFKNRAALFAAVACPFVSFVAFADLSGSYTVPLDHDAIRYATAPLHDRITLLEHNLEDGKAKLHYVPDLGYLPSLLGALDLPISSQVLVFSKTSFQAPRISPRTPRALYFNDTTAVGWVKGGDVIEIADVDPRQGVVFYTLDQEEVAHPRIQRRGECLQCHHSGSTLGVPGLLVRSVYPEHSGMPMFQAGSFITDHRSPLKERWGGWYVTGTHGSQLHMGNNEADANGQMDLTAGANITDLKDRFTTISYLSPHSDIVALMTLEHQSRMVNMITRVGYETRMALLEQAGINRSLGEPADHMSDSTQHRIKSMADELVKYMLFANETPLTAEIKGTSNFAAEFTLKGPRDKDGRSLRDFDLKTRMFRYPCSYLIYSEAFDQLPDAALQQIYRRMWEVLSGRDAGKDYEKLTKADRQAVLEILRATKPNVGDYWPVQ